MSTVGLTMGRVLVPAGAAWREAGSVRSLVAAWMGARPEGMRA